MECTCGWHNAGINCFLSCRYVRHSGDADYDVGHSIFLCCRIRSPTADTNPFSDWVLRLHRTLAIGEGTCRIIARRYSWTICHYTKEGDTQGCFFESLLGTSAGAGSCRYLVRTGYSSQWQNISSGIYRSTSLREISIEQVPSSSTVLVLFCRLGANDTAMDSVLLKFSCGCANMAVEVGHLATTDARVGICLDNVAGNCLFILGIQAPRLHPSSSSRCCTTRR